MDRPTEYRFYSDLAPWWPLISPPDDYAEEAEELAGLLESAERPVREVLEIGSGGGHNAVHLSARFALTLLDLSPDMLAASRELNPRCEHVIGDMRTARLGRLFDAVLVHDAIEYMTGEDDLREVFATMYAHCRPGGVAVVVPDDTAETFIAATDCGGSDGPDGRGARYLEWTWDPDPADTWVIAEYAVMLREADGQVRTFHETHRIGLFPRGTWCRLLADAGFDVEVHIERHHPGRRPREMFLGRRRQDGPRDRPTPPNGACP